LKFYICNVATQPGETDGYDCYDHVRTIEKHIGGGIFDLILCNNRDDGRLPVGIDWVLPTGELLDEYPVYCADLLDLENAWRHNPAKLAQAVMDLYYEKTGPLSVRDNYNNPEN
jgi:2-phospho-L-lactate transferase/gluconeogenesis factor (CofD/UPF0052 family)